MKKLYIAMAALVCSMSINAQIMKVMKGDKVVATYNAKQADRVVFEEGKEPAPVTDTNLLTGKFTVSDGKTVQFTKGNLYWDGNDFKFEANQYDYPTEWSTDHVGYFYWTTTAEASYAGSYYSGVTTTADRFWLDGSDAEHMLTVEGIDGLYVLSDEEWYYLLITRTDAEKLYRAGVEVAGKANCLIIAPDDYDYKTNPIQPSYDEESWADAEANGLVCLIATCYRSGASVLDGDSESDFWSSTPSPYYESNANNLFFNTTFVNPASGSSRTFAFALRLVR